MKKIILILVTVLVAASCSDNLESLNENIKDPASVSGESLFISAEKTLVDQMAEINVNLNNTSLWAQFLQETTYLDESQYDQVTRSIPARNWNVFYKDVLKDLDEAAKIIEATQYGATQAAQKPNKLAIIEILTIYSYATLVETYGDVPYSEALDPENNLPAYDDGLTVYKDLLVRLNAVIGSLNTGEGSFELENIYDGNVAQWKKFANSLKLRMGLLLADVEPALAQSTVESAAQASLISSNADNAAYAYTSTDPNTNPKHVNLVLSGRQDYVAAVTIIDNMNTLDDPRRPFYFTDVDGDFVGGEIGESSPYASNSKPSDLVADPTSPGVIFDYAEVEFLLAEAAARGYSVGGTASSHYVAGVNASMEFWGATTAEAATYLAQPGVDYATALANSTSSPTWKEVIGTQKWLAYYNRGIEAWTSIRRLDYPAMATPTDALTGYPARYFYPIDEQTLNGTNYDAASSAIGGDTAENKLFFDLF